MIRPKISSYVWTNLHAAIALFATYLATTATTLTTGTTTISTKAKGIKAKLLDNIEIILNKIEKHCAHIRCQKNVSVKLQERWWY